MKNARAEGLMLTNVPKPAIGPNDVLIEVSKILGGSSSFARAEC